MVWEIKGVNICCKEKKSLLENSEMGGGGGEEKECWEESKSTNVPRQQKSFVLGWCF